MSRADTRSLKGLAILCVLLGHLNYLDSSGAWGVHIFLLLSGYGLESSYQKKGLNGYWKNRIFKVWVPYEVVILIVLLVEFIARNEYSVLSIIASISGTDFGYNIDPSMWYISYIFLLYVEFFLWKKFKRGKIREYGYLILFMVFNFILSITDKFSPLSIWSPTAQAWIYTFDFFIGIAMVHKKKNSIFLNFVAAVSILYFFVRYGSTHFKADMVLFTFAAAVSIIIIVTKFKLSKFNLLQKLGDISFCVYLVEGHLLRWKDYYLQWIHNNNIRKVVVFVFCLIVGYMVYKIMNVFYIKIES